MTPALGILTVVVFVSSIPKLLSIDPAMCAGLGYSNLTSKGLGLQSMGASSLFIHPLNTFWAANLIPTTYANRKDIIDIRIDSVEQELPNGIKSIMKGWLFLSIKKASGDHFSALAVWATAESRQTVGEFVHLPVNGCGLWTEPKNYIPCSAVGVNWPMNSNLFVYTSDGTGPPVTEVRLMWKMSTGYCYKPAVVKFNFVFNSKKWNNVKSVPEFDVKSGRRTAAGIDTELGPMLMFSQPMFIVFYGSAAPLFDPASLQCRRKNDVMRNLPFWVRTKIIPYPEAGKPGPPGVKVGSWGIRAEGIALFYRERFHYQTGVEDKGVTSYIATCKPNWQGFLNFGGRCESIPNGTHLVYSNLRTSPQCLFQDWAFDRVDVALFSTRSFKDALVVRQSDVSRGCDPSCLHAKQNIPSRAEVIQVSSHPTFRSAETVNNFDNMHHEYRGKSRGCVNRNDSAEANLFGLCVYSDAGQLVFGVRQWHALATLFCVLIIVPTMRFMAQYFKGPLTVEPESGQQYLPVKYWYIVHMFLIIPMFCLFASAMTSVFRQRNAVGHSKSPYATFHRIGGYIYYGLCTFEVLSGFLRPLNIHLRKIAIFMHWMVGVILNYGGTLLCIFTYGIPASPITHVSHLNKSEFLKIYNHLVPVILLFWFLMEVIFQIIMTTRTVRFDRVHHITRSYFPIFLPPNVNNRDLRFASDYKKEEAFNARALMIYTFLCLMFYVVCVITMFLDSVQGDIGLGPMTCTHDRNDEYIAGRDNTPSLTKFYTENKCEYFLTI